MFSVTRVRERAIALEYSRYMLMTISTLVMTPILLTSLGTRAYGLLAALTSATAFLNIADFGVSSALPRLVARHNAQEDYLGVKRIVSTAVALYLFLAVALCLSAGTLSTWLGFFLKIEQDLINQAVGAAMLAIVTIALSLLVTPMSGLLYGLHRLDLMSIASILGIVLTTVLTVIFSLLSYGVVEIQLARSLGAIATAVVIIHFTVRVAPRGLLCLKCVNVSTLRRILSMSTPLFIIGLGHVTLFYIDNLVIGRVLGTGAVAGYAISFQLIATALQLLFLMGGVFVPWFSEESAKGNTAALGSVFRKYSRASFSLGTLLFGGLLLLGNDFIFVWTGKAELVTKEVMATLSFLVLIRGITHPGAVLLSSIGRQMVVAKYQIAEGVLNLFISVMLAKPLGVLGVALGSVIAQFITTLVVVPWYSATSLTIRHLDYVRLLVPSAIVGIIAFTLASLVYLILPMGVIRILLSGSTLVTGFLILGWRFLLNEQERKLLIFRLSLAKSDAHVLK